MPNGVTAEAKKISKLVRGGAHQRTLRALGKASKSVIPASSARVPTLAQVSKKLKRPF